MKNLDRIIDRIIAEETGRQVAVTGKTPSCNWCWVCPECRTQLVEHIVHNGAARVGAAAGVGPLHDGMAQYIDHTLLKPEATHAQIEKLCAEALEYQFASVCVNPTWVETCSRLLGGSPGTASKDAIGSGAVSASFQSYGRGAEPVSASSRLFGGRAEAVPVLVCTVVGFPLGATTTETKAFETRQAVELGAGEIDMVINVGRLKSGDDDCVTHDIYHVVRAASGRQVKVIIEACYLTDEEKMKAALLAREAGAHFVKTSTGFGPGGAKIEDVALLRRVVGESMGVKAAGGIRDTAAAEQMIAAGASRLGASASIAIVERRKAA